MRLALVFPQSMWDLFVFSLVSQHNCTVDKLPEEFIVEIAIIPKVSFFVFHVDC